MQKRTKDIYKDTFTWNVNQTIQQDEDFVLLDVAAYDGDFTIVVKSSNISHTGGEPGKPTIRIMSSEDLIKISDIPVDNVTPESVLSIDDGPSSLTFRIKGLKTKNLVVRLEKKNADGGTIDKIDFTTGLNQIVTLNIS